MMTEPLMGLAAVYAERFGMLPSVFEQQATQQDLATIMAADMIKNPEWRKNYERQHELDKQRDNQLYRDEQLKKALSALGGKNG